MCVCVCVFVCVPKKVLGPKGPNRFPALDARRLAYFLGYFLGIAGAPSSCAPSQPGFLVDLCQSHFYLPIILMSAPRSRRGSAAQTQAPPPLSGGATDLGVSSASSSGDEQHAAAAAAPAARRLSLGRRVGPQRRPSAAGTGLNLGGAPPAAAAPAAAPPLLGGPTGPLAAAAPAAAPPPLGPGAPPAAPLIGAADRLRTASAGLDAFRCERANASLGRAMLWSAPLLTDIHPDAADFLASITTANVAAAKLASALSNGPTWTTFITTLHNHRADADASMQLLDDAAASIGGGGQPSTPAHAVGDSAQAPSFLALDASGAVTTAPRHAIVPGTAAVIAAEAYAPRPGTAYRLPFKPPPHTRFFTGNGPLIITDPALFGNGDLTNSVRAAIRAHHGPDYFISTLEAMQYSAHLADAFRTMDRVLHITAPTPCSAPTFANIRHLLFSLPSLPDPALRDAFSLPTVVDRMHLANTTGVDNRSRLDVLHFMLNLLPTVYGLQAQQGVAQSDLTASGTAAYDTLPPPSNRYTSLFAIAARFAAFHVSSPSYPANAVALGGEAVLYEAFQGLYAALPAHYADTTTSFTGFVHKTPCCGRCIDAHDGELTYCTDATHFLPPGWCDNLLTHTAHGPRMNAVLFPPLPSGPNTGLIGIGGDSTSGANSGGNHGGHSGHTSGGGGGGSGGGGGGNGGGSGGFGFDGSASAVRAGGGGAAVQAGEPPPHSSSSPGRPPHKVDLSLPRNLARKYLFLVDNILDPNYPEGLPPNHIHFQNGLWNPTCPDADRRCFRCFTAFHGDGACLSSSTKSSTKYRHDKLPSGKPASYFFLPEAITKMRRSLSIPCPPDVKAVQNGERNFIAFRTFLEAP